MNIGDLFLTLLADGSKLTPSVQKEAAKAGDAGAKTLGQKLSGGLKGEAFRVLGGMASAAFGLATKGALELENATARFRAETGASADEAVRAGKIINKVAGDERMSLDAVTDIAIRVKRDLGAVGDEADQLTADIAKFARVTRQDGGGAVSALDDIMDNWGLTLKDAKSLMDRLLVSQQRWGGDLQGNQVTLAKLAPAMKAANFEIDDGIALLGLFGAKGLDSERAAAAFSKALTKVKSPEELKRLIEDISNTEDPFERAQKAADLFGAKAGAQLANALGNANLDDYKVSVEDAAGAVEKAGDVIDNTISGKIAKAFSQGAAAVRGFGAEFGAAATGIASLVSLVATLGGGKLLKGLASVTLKPLAGLGVRIATFIGAEMAGSAAVQGIGSRLAAGINKLPGVGALKTAGTKLGNFLGSTVGKAFGLTMAVVFVAWFVDEINKQRAEIAGQLQGIAGDVSNQITSGTTAQLEQSRAAIKTALDQIEADTKRGLIQMATPQQIDALKGLVDQYNAIQTELNERAALAAKVAESQLRAAQLPTANAARDLVNEIPTAFDKNQAFAAARTQAFLDMTIGQRLQAMGPEVLRRSAEIALNVAAGLRDKRAAVEAAMAQLKDDMLHPLSRTKEVAHDLGLLFGKTLSHGLKSSDPVIKAQAQGTRALIEAELIETVKAGGAAGQKIQEELEKKLHSKDPAVKAQAQRTKSVIDEALKANTAAKTPGDVIGDQLNADLKDKNTALGKTAYSLGRTIAANLLAGVKGTGVVRISSGTSSQYAGKTIPEYDSGTGFVPQDQLAVVHRREIVVPAVDADAIRAGDAVLGTSGGAGDTYNTTLVIPEATKRDPFEVLELASRYQRFGALNPPKDRAA